MNTLLLAAALLPTGVFAQPAGRGGPPSRGKSGRPV